MKYTVLIVAICLASAVRISAQPIWGQDTTITQRQWKLYAGAGLGSPRGSFTRMYNLGMNLHGSFGLELSRVVQLRVKMELHRFGADQAVALPYYRRIARASGSSIEMTGGSMNVMTFGADVKHDFPSSGSRLVPFVLAGTGIAISSVSTVTLRSTTREWTVDPEGRTDFLFEVGGGLEVVMTPAMSFFVQGRYIGVHGDRSPMMFLPLTFGVRF